MFHLLANGLRTLEIAARLGASHNTVRNHLTAIRRKLDCENIERLRMLAARQLF